MNDDTKPIRVLLVDDSTLWLTVLKRMLSGHPGIIVAGTASDGKEALELIPALDPQVICTDLHMPQMDGLELTRQIMDRFPRPILLISSTVDPDNLQKVYPIMQAGALDVFPKPSVQAGSEFEKTQENLVAKIRILAGVHVFRRRSLLKPDRTSEREITTSRSLTSLRVDQVSQRAPDVATRPDGPISRIVVVGASTGGPPILGEIFGDLPGDFRFPILCVQHISKGFLPGLIDWLDGRCRVGVKIASSGEILKPATVYFAPEDRHLEVDERGMLSYSIAAPVDGHRPSATYTMAVSAERLGAGTIGVLLTGMGADGANGLLAIANRGGVTIAQDEASSAVFGMPRRAIELGAARYILPPPGISRLLIRLAGVSR